MIPLFRPSFATEPDAQADALQALQEVLASGQLAEGPLSERLEQRVSAYLGAPARLVNSGTSALRLALHLAGARSGTEVICTPATCLASCTAVLETGATLVWADVAPTTGLLDATSVAAVLSPKTIAILAVDWAGVVCNFHDLRAAAPNVAIVEDAAHAFGPLGDRAARGDFICYSAQAIKHWTCGDGGAIVLPSAALHERARLLRWFGLDRQRGDAMRCLQVMPEAGFKMQPNEIMAAIGLASLRGAAERLEQHWSIARTYRTELPADVQSPAVRDLERHYWWMMPIRVPDPATFNARMARSGVQTGVVHARCDLQPAFDHRSITRVPLPGLEAFYHHQTNLPVGAHLSDQDVGTIIRAAQEALA